MTQDSQELDDPSFLWVIRRNKIIVFQDSQKLYNLQEKPHLISQCVKIKLSKIWDFNVITKQNKREKNWRHFLSSCDDINSCPTNPTILCAGKRYFNGYIILFLGDLQGHTRELMKLANNFLCWMFPYIYFRIQVSSQDVLCVDWLIPLKTSMWKQRTGLSRYLKTWP